MCRPSTADNGVTQERIAWPSKWTVHAPHSAMPQPNLVPGRPATSRTAHNRGIFGSASSVVGLPLSTKDVEIHDRECILLDELSPRLDLIAHQRGEDLVGGHGVLDPHLHEPSRLRVDRGLPKLLGIHLAQALVALYRLTFAGLVEQPDHGLLESADVLALVAAPDVSALADQARERARELGDALVFGRFKEFPMQ